MKKIIPIIFLSIILFAGLTVATSCSGKPESIPKIYYGEVEYNNGGLFELNKPLNDAEYPLTAWIGNDRVGYGNVVNGEYSIEVVPCWGDTGEINFIINGVQSDDEGSYSGQADWGAEEELKLLFVPKPPRENTCGDNSIQLGEECDGINLGGRNPNSCGTGWVGTISCSSDCEIDYSNCTLAPYCGDGIVNNGETCSSCPADAGACASSSSGGSSGGGGGSSSSSKKTTSSNNLTTLSTNESIVGENETIDLNGTENSDAENKKGITGLAVGDFVKSTGGKISIGVLALIILILIFVSIKKNKKEMKVVKLSEMKNKK